jgi:transcriptional regulator
MNAEIEVIDVDEGKMLTPQEIVHALMANGWRQVDIANRTKIHKADVSRINTGQLKKVFHLRYFALINIINEPPPVRAVKATKAIVKKRSVQYLKGFAAGVASKEGCHE